MPDSSDYVQGNSDLVIPAKFMALHPFKEGVALGIPSKFKRDSQVWSYR